MNEAAWVRVKPESQAHGLTDTVRGVLVSVEVSPYDQPTAIRGSYVPERGAFRIEFKYSDNEPCVERRISEIAVIYEGAHSKKLVAIEVLVDEHKIDRVALIVEALERAGQTVKHLLHAPPRPSARLNYGVVDRLLATSRKHPEELLAAQ